MIVLFFISGVEIVFIMLIVVVLFGADKIPEIAHGLGKAIKQIRYATNEMKYEIKKSAEEYGIDDELNNAKKAIDKSKDAIEKTVTPIKRTLEK